MQTFPAAAKPDEAIVENASAAGLPAHTHTASQVSDFSTAADARIANAVGDTVQAYITQGGAISDASGGATVDAEARTAINAVLAFLRAEGLIAT